MARIILLLVLFVSNSMSTSDPIRLSEPIYETSEYEIFGELPISKNRGDTITEIVSEADKHDGEVVRITTNISKVCQRKGCFFVAVEGETWARIIFKDYSFFLPTDSSGKQVTLEGTLTRRILSDGQARHYAEDLKLAHSDPSRIEEYLITASSVILMK